MSTKQAVDFFNRCRVDSTFRQSLYKCENRSELLCKAKNEGFKFTTADAEAALQNMKMQAAHEDEAAEINELKLWFELQTGGEDENPLAVCAGCSLRASCSNYKAASSTFTASSKQEK